MKLTSTADWLLNAVTKNSETTARIGATLTATQTEVVRLEGKVDGIRVTLDRHSKVLYAAGLFVLFGVTLLGWIGTLLSQLLTAIIKAKLGVP